MKVFFHKNPIIMICVTLCVSHSINAQTVATTKTSKEIEMAKTKDIKIDIHQTIKVLEDIDLHAQKLFLSSELKKKWHDWKEKKQEQFLLYAAKHLDPDEILLFQELPFEMQWKIIVKLQKGMIHDVKVYFLKQIENFQRYRPI